jgi:hypothetical protein
MTDGPSDRDAVKPAHEKRNTQEKAWGRMLALFDRALVD